MAKHTTHQAHDEAESAISQQDAALKAMFEAVGLNAKQYPDDRWVVSVRESIPGVSCEILHLYAKDRESKNLEFEFKGKEYLYHNVTMALKGMIEDKMLWEFAEAASKLTDSLEDAIKIVGNAGQSATALKQVVRQLSKVPSSLIRPEASIGMGGSHIG